MFRLRRSAPDSSRAATRFATTPASAIRSIRVASTWGGVISRRIPS